MATMLPDDIAAPKVDHFDPQEGAPKRNKRAKEKRRMRADLDPSLKEGRYAARKVDSGAAFGMSDEDSEVNVSEAEYNEQEAEAALDDMFADFENADDDDDGEDLSYEEFEEKLKQKAAARSKQRMEKLKQPKVDVREVAAKLEALPEANWKENLEKQHEKGLHAKNQFAIQAQLTNLRIRLQNPLTVCNRLPDQGTHWCFVQSRKKIKASMGEARVVTREVLNDMTELHFQLVNQNPSVWAVDGRKERPSKRDREDNSIEAHWQLISSLNTAIMPFIESTLDSWHAKTKTMQASLEKKADSAFMQQIRAHLENMDKHTQHTQVNRLQARPVGEEAAPETSTEMYDDNDFYGVLLNEVITKGMDESQAAAQEHLKQKMAVKQKSAASRRKVKKPNTKGRTIRFDIQERIVNFMAPEPLQLPPHTDALFGCLFQN
eukprot:NODE_1681_length_1415_cov_44.482143_g1595_i0.p1 GENE.NODE_1681_length_1415_cov_44.482143_g1595_i0~~NODE_1681_length_1415_cov_44.482143_g1595_i0.p1  ORF type:complete len:434 (+),score=156.31 NODE_1681_length_1415_cov_44.482143_g1595_i0:14-1315(+)